VVQKIVSLQTESNKNESCQTTTVLGVLRMKKHKNTTKIIRPEIVFPLFLITPPTRHQFESTMRPYYYKLGDLRFGRVLSHNILLYF